MLAAMGSLVDDIRVRVDKRLEELEPLVREYEELKRLRSQLDGQPQGPRSPRRAARRRGGPTRAEQSMTLVGERPGITTDEIAQAMGIDRNYLYRVLPRLEREGRLVRAGGGWRLPHGAGRSRSPA